MATLFTNQASITFSDQTVPSNIVTLVNTSASAFNNLQIVDNMGAYSYGTPAKTLVPLDYVAGSIKYFVDGVMQTAPTVSVDATTKALTISGINVSAKGAGTGNTHLIYEATTNEFAPLGINNETLANSLKVTNTVTVTGTGITKSLTASSTVYPPQTLDIDIVKLVTPSSIAQNGQLTYTVEIYNYGPVGSVDADNVILKDTFDPYLDPISPVLNGQGLTETTQYTYDDDGNFATVADVISLTKADITQDPTTGEWIVAPSKSILVVTGTITSKPTP